jgi:predicted DNA-binding transcriptional regulator YafY
VYAGIVDILCQQWKNVLKRCFMRADRLLSMLLLLQSHERMTAELLADKLDVSKRTVYRDIDALCYSGIPIYTQPGTQGGVFLD